MDPLKRVLSVIAVAALFLTAGLPFGWAEEKALGESTHKVKNYRGLQFKVPEDWPIEKVGNTIGPIPIEDYMSRKFAVLTERIEKQDKAMAALEKRVETVERRKRLNG